MDTSITQGIAPTGPITRLTGRWLWLGRAAWLILFATGLALAAGVIANPALIFFTRDAFELRPACQVLGVDLNSCATPFLIVRYGIITLILAATSILIVWRKSDDRAALLIACMITAFAFYNFGDRDMMMASASLPRYIASLGLQAVAQLCFLVLLFVFPDGRFVPRWGRWVSLMVLPGMAANIFVLLNEQWVFYRGEDGPVFALNLTIYAVCVAVGVAAQAYRYRALATPQERQQTKWVLVALIAMALWLALMELLLARVGTLPMRPLDRAVLIIAGRMVVAPLLLLVVPVAILFAVFRYRIWDIDFVINRALVLGIMAVLFVVTAAGSLFAISQIAANLPGGPLVGVAIGAAVFGVAFNPVYKECRTFVDKLYGIKLDYAKAIKAYGDAKREDRRAGDTRNTFGNYSGLTLLGRGGMGEVYRAQHPTLNRPVAIKVLPSQSAGMEEAEKRFMREAQTVAKLKHPNIITMHDVGEQDGQPFMVMEYIDGQDLSDLLRQRGHLPVGEALPILNDIAAALDYAHSQGVIHRDIKPSNVMVEKTTTSGSKSGIRAVLMDFGIAKSYASTRLTQSGGMIGTLDYISPEQIQGAAEVDARADTYSFGVMAYQVLTGKLPFAHNNPGAMVLAHLNQPAPDPRESVSNLPDSAAIAVMRAMSKKPDQRFDTAGAFVAAMA